MRTSFFTISFALLGGMLLCFILLPLLGIFFQTPVAQLQATLFDLEVGRTLGITFYAAAWATLLALITGIPLAYLLARHRFPGKRWIEGLIDLPIVIPHTAAGIALLSVFGRQGVAGRLAAGVGLSFIDSIPGIVVGMLFVSLPYLVNTAREAFARVDPEMELVAETLGATRWQAFRYVTLPLAARGILAGALLMWGRGISEFGAVMILAYHPQIVPVLVYERFAGFGLNAARPVAVLLLLVALGIFALLRRLVQEE